MRYEERDDEASSSNISNDLNSCPALKEMLGLSDSTVASAASRPAHQNLRNCILSILFFIYSLPV